MNLDLTYEEFRRMVQKRYGRDMYIAASVYREIFKFGNLDLRRVTAIARDMDFVRHLEEDLIPGITEKLPEVIEEKKGSDFVKFLLRYSDGSEIEAVLLTMFTHKTLCVSSQVGCKMGCRFCETAKIGFKRDLTSFEILAQVYLARKKYDPAIRNVVFMGMGEPFDNFENVMTAIRVLNDPRGFDIALRHITVSTSGRVDGIERLALLDMPGLNLAVSINGPNDSIRSELMPINKKYPMEVLKKALMAFPMRKKDEFFLEYVLIKGVNDSEENARELTAYIRDLPAHVNLIPYNPGKDTVFKAPDEEGVEAFRQYLIDLEVKVRRRAIKGQELMAACGQLSASR